MEGRQMLTVSANLSQIILQGIAVFALVQSFKDFGPIKAFFDAHDSAALWFQAGGNFLVAISTLLSKGSFTGADLATATWVSFGAIAMSKLSHMTWTVVKAKTVSAPTTVTPTIVPVPAPTVTVPATSAFDAPTTATPLSPIRFWSTT
jgi:hypothetical protein